MSADELKGFLATAVALAKEVGPAFKDGFWRKGQFANADDFAVEGKKGNAADCVTAVDCHIERVLFSRLRSIYPHHKFVGEETTAECGDAAITDDPTWIVDPVDGTNNFVHHHHFTGVSIGLAIDKQPVVGVVYLPILDELYTGIRGQGSFLNGQRLPLVGPLTTPTSLAQCMMVSEHGSSHDETMHSRMRSLTRLLLAKEHGGAGLESLRFAGAATSDMSLIAKGVAEVHWEIGLHAWDIAAASVIVTESGGAVFDGSGWWGLPEGEREPQPLNIWNRKIVSVRYIPDLPGQPGSGRELQIQLAKELLSVVEDIPCTPDGLH
ncbi:hypothetical protein H4S07_003236 [Coemansia furcata]|uniref:Uncharacterized protein n=1 Tax=Coemansia furcata TaxID=417177 RepID=A0ACC1LJ25_9FUNG|nr:hypothetical protein H4S07_003236 [Coemansia furcata]